jgi:hypothetical protein
VTTKIQTCQKKKRRKYIRVVAFRNNPFEVCVSERFPEIFGPPQQGTERNQPFVCFTSLSPRYVRSMHENVTQSHSSPCPLPIPTLPFCTATLLFRLGGIPRLFHFLCHVKKSHYYIPNTPLLFSSEKRKSFCLRFPASFEFSWKFENLFVCKPTYKEQTSRPFNYSKAQNSEAKVANLLVLQLGYS